MKFRPSTYTFLSIMGIIEQACEKSILNPEGLSESDVSDMVAHMMEVCMLHATPKRQRQWAIYKFETKLKEIIDLCCVMEQP